MEKKLNSFLNIETETTGVINQIESFIEGLEYCLSLLAQPYLIWMFVTAALRRYLEAYEKLDTRNYDKCVNGSRKFSNLSTNQVL